MNSLLDLLALTSPWELLAVLLALAYVVLAIQRHVLCWPAAAISAGIYTWLFLHSGLYMESLLQLFYILMAGYGLYNWLTFGKENSQARLTIVSYSGRFHLYWLGFLLVVTAIIALLLARTTQATMVWLDTPTTVFSLFATFLVARRVLENWLYWVVIDAAYVVLFWYKGFYPTAILFAGYTLMALYGYWRWRQDFREQQREQQIEAGQTVQVN